ncbi:MAG: 50S ribosomal protein L33 [Candidatus Moranbacteria bacterium]|nr:50S ribosomal protein L33 [Candidatus Moranbacteria bacterium]
MSQDNLIRLQCSECKKINYYSQKNQKKIQEKLQLKKHCPNCKKHTKHMEKKKK